MKKFAFFAFAFVFLLSAQSAFPKEKARKTRFRLVDSFIAKRDYNHALALLEEISRNYPSDFDAVQKRVRKIQKRRQEYNKTVEKLIKIIEEDHLNTHGQLVLIEALQKMEINPGQAEIDFLEFSYANATYSRIFLLLEKLMLDGEEYVRRGEKEILGEIPSDSPGSSYETAWKIFSEGFSLNREEFDEREFSDRFVRQVDGNIKAARDECFVEFQKFVKTLPPLVDRFVSHIEAGEYAKAEALWPQVSSQMTEFSLLFNKISKIGEFFYDEWQGFLYEDQYYSPMCFIPVVYRIVTSKDGGIYTGLLGTVENMWTALFSKMKRAVNAHLEEHWQIAQEDIPADDPFSHFEGSEREEKLLPTEKTLARIGANINALNAARVFSRGTKKRDFGKYDVALDAYKIISEGFLENLPNVKNFAFLKSTAPEEIDADGEIRLDEETRENLLLREKLIDGYAVIEENAKKILEKFEKINREYDTSGEYETPLPTAETEEYARKVISQTVDITKKSQNDIWKNLLAFLKQGTENETEICQSEVGLAHAYFDGEKNAETGEIDKYPQESFDEADSAVKTIDDVERFLSEQDSVLHLAPEEISSGEGFSEIVEKNSQALQILRALRDDAAALRDEAQEKVKMSKEERKKGDGFFRRAEGFFGGNRFDEARDSLQRARESYIASLAIQQDLPFRAESDEKIQELLLRINDEENKFVVREVRRLYNLAEGEFDRERYSECESLLLQARALWRKTNATPHSEVESLLARVGLILSMQLDRAIPKESPLYPEFSQLMSDAQGAFEKGRVLFSKGKKDEAGEFFDEAGEKTRAVKRAFPWHKEASLLQLKMQKILDYNVFLRNFAEQFDFARKSYTSPEKQKDAYLTLLDLYEMNPNYPNLKKTIWDAEIYIGIRKPPPDRSAQIRSQNLLAKAREAENSRDEIAIRAAIQQLEEAVEIDGKNQEATRLLDRYRLMIGGQNISVLSAKSELLYQQAVRSLQRNDVVEAVALLNVLLRESDAQNSNKVRDLQKRVNLMAQ